MAKSPIRTGSPRASDSCTSSKSARSATSSSEGLAKDLCAATPDRAAYCPTPADAAEAIRALAKEGDVVVVMGAGDVIKVTQILFG